MLNDYINIMLLIILSNPLIILACDDHYYVCQMVIFYFCHTIHIYSLEFYCKKKFPSSFLIKKKLI